MAKAILALIRWWYRCTRQRYGEERHCISTQLWGCGSRRVLRWLKMVSVADEAADIAPTATSNKPEQGAISCAPNERGSLGIDFWPNGVSPRFARERGNEVAPPTLPGSRALRPRLVDLTEALLFQSAADRWSREHVGGELLVTRQFSYLKLKAARPKKKHGQVRVAERVLFT